MKLEVNNYIYDKFHERGMKAFENKGAKILRGKGLTQGTFICLNAYMVRGNGYGSYFKRIEFSFGGTTSQTYTEHTNDSVLWDNWNAQCFLNTEGPKIFMEVNDMIKLKLL